MLKEPMLKEPIELDDADLDLVTGGIAGGLVNVLINDVDVQLLKDANIKVLNGNTVTIKDIANYNHIGVGAVIQALGGVAGVLTNA